MTPDRADQNVAMLRAGTPANTAARAAGISERTLRVWIARGIRGDEIYRQFREQLEQAKAQGEVRQVAQIAAAAANKEKPDWRASAWLLDRGRFGGDTAEPLDPDPIAQAAADDARDEARVTLLSLGEDPALSRGAVERYAASMAVCAVLDAQWKHLGSPSTAPGGSTGTAPVPHPLLGMIAQARKEAGAHATLLGLDPLGRMRISRQLTSGRPQGAESAPDRVAPVGIPRRTLRVVSRE
jgi:hypothetical protein